MTFSPQPATVQTAPRTFGPKIQAFLIAGLVLVLDHLSKALVSAVIPYGHSVPILGNFVRLTYIRNPNALFGISLGEHFPYPLAGLIATLVILVALFLEQEPVPIRIFGLFLGGALGNVIDRLRFGSVVDFIDVGIGRYRWPVFNLADSAITIGLVLYVVYVMWGHRKRQREESP